mmetsp:Transcript_27031/g.39553  ORF Transcript_27031/g.39553 Transcript_27031/m.39553 type:complete len:166 (-) Transcript_27031:1922-2419(-)
MVSISSGRKRKKLSKNYSIFSPSLIVSVLLLSSSISIICYVTLIAMHLSQQKQPYDGIFVISLQGTPNADPHNEGRLDDFKKAWRKSCGSDPEINVCPGVMDDRRGYGLTRSWLNCLQMAKNMNLEVTMVFEDDARLFDNVSSLNFCDAEKRVGKVCPIYQRILS